MTIKALYLNTHFPMSFQLQSKHSKSTVLLSIHFMWPDPCLKLLFLIFDPEQEWSRVFGLALYFLNTITYFLIYDPQIKVSA